MPFTKQPSLIRLTGKADSGRFIIPFVYDFQGDSAVLQNIGGVPVLGSLFSINVSSYSNVLNLPAIRSMQFSQEFILTADDTPSVGELNINVPATGYLTRVAYGGSYPNPFATTNGLVSGVIPIVANEPSVIQFCKAVNSDTTMSGILTGCLFTFDVAPYIVQGLSDTD